jgi:hypothetical protein
MSLDGAEYVLGPEVGTLDGAAIEIDGVNREEVVVKAFVVPRGSGSVVAVVVTTHVRITGEPVRVVGDALS